VVISYGRFIVQSDAHRTLLGGEGGPYIELPFPAADAVDRLLVALFRHGVAYHFAHIRQQIANGASRNVVAIPIRSSTPRGLEPVAAVGDPPGGKKDRDGGGAGPPKRKQKIGHQP
jgi:hypothetical protein